MRRFRDLGDLGPGDRGAAVAMGNFDGVHLGHQSVLALAHAAAAELDAPLGVVTFEPHPRSFFAPDAAPFRLMTGDARPAAAVRPVEHVDEHRVDPEARQVQPVEPEVRRREAERATALVAMRDPSLDPVPVAEDPRRLLGAPLGQRRADRRRGIIRRAI